MVASRAEGLCGRLEPAPGSGAACKPQEAAGKPRPVGLTGGLTPPQSDTVDVIRPSWEIATLAIASTGNGVQRAETIPRLRPRPMSASSPRVLLVEDDALIGWNIEEMLAAAGWTVVGPFDRCVAALDWLRAETPDAAVIDVSLRDGPCVELARLLQGRGVPFVVHSATRKIRAAAEFQGASWLEKPAAPDLIVTALRSIRAGAPHERSRT